MIRLAYKDAATKDIARYIRKHFNTRPGNIGLYVRALTHKSSTAEGESKNNERLEFLGDAILGSIVTEYLFDLFPGETEGFLTEIRALIVSRKNLNRMAAELEIEKHIIHDRDIDVHQSSVGGNAFEALIGALFLDKGYIKARKAVTGLLRRKVNIDLLQQTDVNYKSKLLEWAQKEKRTVKFRVAGDPDKEQSDIFTVSVLVDGEVMGYGGGKTKKAAEKAAAMGALEALGIKP